MAQLKRDDVMVVQMGARRAYELAQMLELRGRLCCLQTDYASHSSTTDIRGRILSTIYPKLQAFERRTVNGIPARKIYSSVAPNIAGGIARAVGLGSQITYDIEDAILGLSSKSRLNKRPAIILNTAGNGGYKFLQNAKSQGKKIISDIVIIPQALDVEYAEQQRWPQWIDGGHVKRADIERYRDRITRLIEVSDVLLCPSQGVIEGIKEFGSVRGKRLELLHYSLGEFTPKRGHPRPGRILFAGSAPIRKGLPYLARAASILKERRVPVDVRVAGDFSPKIAGLPDCSALNFLGKLSRKRMELELAAADVFCLPSHAEGMASAASEAMCFGVPLVVTLQAGAPITNMREGIIVPAADPVALADAIETLTTNRTLRDQMGEFAFAKAGELTSDGISRNLELVLDSLEP